MAEPLANSSTPQTDGDGAPVAPDSGSPPPLQQIVDLVAKSALDPTDDTPTIISRTAASPIRVDEVLADVLRGRRLAHFELLETIGVGGMAAVIRGRDTQLDRTVALKILPPEFAGDPEIVRRFHQEARAAARLDHENIARVFFCGEDQGLHFIAFECVEGDNLRTYVERHGRLKVADAIGFVLQIATGLAHAAERGVVHRDIKPSNIIITPGGRAKLVDMGLARSQDPQIDGGLTQSGVTLGTFDYISPEQALEPRDADVRSDIYSLGCTFYHLLTGQPTVPEGTAAKKLHHHQHVAPLDPRQLNPNVPDDVAAVLGRMIAKNPADRYQKPEDLVQHLIVLAKKLGAGTDDTNTLLFVDATLPGRQRSRPLLVGTLAIACLVFLIFFFGPASRPDRAALEPQKKPDDSGTLNAPSENASQNEAKENLSATTPKETLVPDVDEKTSNYHARDAKGLVEFLQKNRKAHVFIEADLKLSRNEQLLFDGKELIMESSGTGEGAMRTISLEYDSHPAPDLWSILNVRRGKVVLRKLRFRLNAHDADVEIAAIRVQGGEVQVESCEFGQADMTSPEVTSIHITGTSTSERSTLNVTRSYFVSGQHAVTVRGTATVDARDCAFGPHGSELFHIQPENVRARSETSVVRLLNCSAMMQSSAVFRLEETPACRLEVENCLFSRPEARTNGRIASLIEQAGSRTADLQYVGYGNCYHNLEALLVQSRLGESRNPVANLAAFRRVQGIKDDKSFEAGESPWEDGRSLQLLQQDNPRAAFRLNTRNPLLRSIRDSRLALGVDLCAWGETYDGPLPGLTSVALQENTRIVDPALSAPEAGTYRSLATALEDAKPGLKILIRHNGLLRCSPVRLEKPGIDVTVEPFSSYRPILTLGDTTEPDAAIFRVHDGQLKLENLEFRLSPQRSEFRAQSVVALVGDGQCTFKNCVVTLDEARDSKDVALALIALADPSTVMKMEPAGLTQQEPRVAIENCFVRGVGSLMAIRASRTFDLKLENCLVALAGSMLVVDGNSKEPGPPAHGEISLRKVTTYLTDHLVHLRAVKEEGKPSRGLAKTQIRSAGGCLFASALGKSLVRLEGVDGVDNEDQMRRFLIWGDSQNNGYIKFTQYLDQQTSMMTMGMMQPSPYGKRQWEDFSHDDTSRFEGLRFVSPPPTDSSLSRSLAADFRAKLEKADVNAPAYGAALELLPVPSADLATP